MQYQKIVLGNTVIEFHNNWQGIETVIVNGQIVSKKSSVWGTNHYFTVMEGGRHGRYALTTRVNKRQEVVLDLTRNGSVIQRDIPVRNGVPQNQRKVANNSREKKQGLLKLQEYELEEALREFKKALELNPKDPEVYFHMACAYSVMEETKKGFEALKNAIQFGLQDHEMILNHDMLAYIRIHDAFDEFLNSGFKTYDATQMQESDTDL